MVLDDALRDALQLIVDGRLDHRRVVLDDVDRDLSAFTIATVEDETVEDRSDEDNVETSVLLEGSDAGEEEGRTDAPNLEEFEADDDDETITYTFDEDIDGAGKVTHPASLQTIHNIVNVMAR